MPVTACNRIHKILFFTELGLPATLTEVCWFPYKAPFLSFEFHTQATFPGSRNQLSQLPAN